jgi:hypothetical protein
MASSSNLLWRRLIVARMHYLQRRPLLTILNGLRTNPASSTSSKARLTQIGYPLSAAANTSLQAATPLIAAATPT